MPRLFIAVVLIQISWPLFTGMITATNNIAWGLEGVLYAPFGGYDAVSLSNTLTKVAGGGQLATLIGGGALWIGLSAPGAIAIAIAILTALFTAYFTLIIRQIVLIVLILTGPIALIAWILPNTEKLWKLWWSTFSKALLMYPLVLMLVASGRIVAHLTAAPADGKNFTTTVMVLIFFFAPFFLLPKTFALAGGAIAGVSGAIASRGAKLRAASNKRSMAKLGKTWGARKQKFQAGGYGSDRNKFTRGIKRAGIMSGQSMWTGFGTTKRGRTNVENQLLANSLEKSKDPGINSLLMDDAARGAVLVGKDKAEKFLEEKGIHKGTDEYTEAMKAAGIIGWDGAGRLAAIQAESTHGNGRNMKAIRNTYGVADDNTAMTAMVADVASASGFTDAGRERLLQGTMYNFGSGARADLRQETLDKVMDAKFDPSLLRGISGDGMDALGGATVNRLLSGNPAEKAQAAAQLLSMHENRTGMSQPAIDALDQQLVRAGIDVSSGVPIETQLALSSVGATQAGNYAATSNALKTANNNLTNSQQAVDDEVASSGTASAATMAALQAARAAVDSARTAHEPNKQLIDGHAQGIRATSATYGSSIPMGAREP